MARNRHGVEFQLDTKDIKELSAEEIKAILRGADDLIATAGRRMTIVK